MKDYGSPENRRINGRQSNNRTIWNTEPWKFRRLLFLSLAQGGCAWCGDIPQVVAHPPNSEYYGKPGYLDFKLSGCYPLCLQCARAEYRGLVLCPRCRRKNHYCAPGEVCWDCKPAEERERLLYLRDKKKHDKRSISQRDYRYAHPLRKIVGKDGKWIRVPR